MMLEQMKTQLASSGIHLSFTNYPLPESAILQLAERNELIGVSPKRYHEFLAGRWCIHQSIKALFPNLQTEIIKTGSGGEPLLPPEIKGSISHCSHIACAAVCSSLVFQSIGLDIESTQRKMSDNAFQWLINEDEKTWITKNGYHHDNVFRIVLFSIKEAVLKTVYTLIGEKIPFSAFSIAAFTLSPLETPKSNIHIIFHDHFFLNKYFFNIYPYILEKHVVCLCNAILSDK